MTHPRSKDQKNRLLKIYNNALGQFKKDQTGYSSIAIIPQSCLGSVAAMLLLMNDMELILKMVLLFFVTILCLAYNGAVLAQLKTKTTFDLLLVSMAFSCIVIIANIF